MARYISILLHLCTPAQWIDIKECCIMIQKPQKATHHVSALFELSGQVEGTSCVVFYTETI